MCIWLLLATVISVYLIARIYIIEQIYLTIGAVYVYSLPPQWTVWLFLPHIWTEAQLIKWMYRKGYTDRME